MRACVRACCVEGLLRPPDAQWRLGGEGGLLCLTGSRNEGGKDVLGAWYMGFSMVSGSGRRVDFSYIYRR